jgi:hypothetical protein
MERWLLELWGAEGRGRGLKCEGIELRRSREAASLYDLSML